MEKSCMSRFVTWLLFTTNFLIFVLGLSVLGLSIWIIVDKPSFLDLFEQAGSVADIPDSFNVEVYTSAAYILLVVSGLVVLFSFLGCCGAVKQNKCMLATYFTLILAMFIVMVVGVVLGYSGNLENTIRNPLKKALSKYRDDITEPTDPLYAYKSVWNEVQQELQCCGVDSVQDWAGNEFNWTPSSANKPLGCCMSNRDGTDMTGEQQLECRNAGQDPESSAYYFTGCYTMFKEKIVENQNVFLQTATAVIIVMFLNMLSSFAMCTMV